MSHALLESQGYKAEGQDGFLHWHKTFMDKQSASMCLRTIKQRGRVDLEVIVDELVGGVVVRAVIQEGLEQRQLPAMRGRHDLAGSQLAEGPMPQPYLLEPIQNGGPALCPTPSLSIRSRQDQKFPEGVPLPVCRVTGGQAPAVLRKVRKLSKKSGGSPLPAFSLQMVRDLPTRDQRGLSNPVQHRHAGFDSLLRSPGC